MFVFVWILCWLNSSILHWTCLYFCLLSLPSPPSLPPSLCIFSLFLFFFIVNSYTAVSLKSLHVSWVVLSYPACTAAIWSSVGSGWVHTFDVGRGGGGQADAMTLLYILLSMVSPSTHCCHQFEKGFFFALSVLLDFFSFWPWNTVHEAEKRGKKTRHCCKQSVSRRIVLMWPTLASTGESNSNCQAEREGGGVCVCVCIV